MYPILKPGTVVIIKQLQRYKKSLTGCFITKEMAELSKSRAKITGIQVDSNNPLEMRYLIDLDDGSYCWAIDFFHPPKLLKRKQIC